jgi:electron transfer flavoprotein alpha subunit
MIRCLIYIDPTETESSLDLIEAARQLHGEAFEVTGVLCSALDQTLPSVFDRLVLVTYAASGAIDPAQVADTMQALHWRDRFQSILIPATPFGRMLAPRLAMLLGTGLVADITQIRRKDGAVEVIRPAYSGSLMACIRYVGDGPMMMSVRPNVFRDMVKAERSMRIETLQSRTNGAGVERIETRPKQISYDIRESGVLVSAGGGAAKSFAKIERLAELLGGKASASRKLVDAGIAPRSIQVGQSGKTVSPELYIALGINGAIQHIEGIKHAKHIISVNINKDAPLSSLSDIVVEGDADRFLDQLIRRIQQHQQSE